MTAPSAVLLILVVLSSCDVQVVGDKLSIVEVVVSDTLSVVVMSLSLAATVDCVILTNSYFLLPELFNLLVGIQFLQFLHNSTFHLHPSSCIPLSAKLVSVPVQRWLSLNALPNSAGYSPTLLKYFPANYYFYFKPYNFIIRSYPDHCTPVACILLQQVH